MSLLTPRLTEEGISMVVAALNGDSITFTRAVIGNTATEPAHPEQLSDVVSPMVTASFTAITEGENFVTLAAVFDNLEVETGAYASELGLYAKDENDNEHLYAYTYVGENADYIPAHDSGRTVQIQMTIVVAIGDAEDVSAVLIDAAAYATREEFEDHIHDYENPHHVNKEQVGLEKVENNFFVDNDIVVDQLTTAANVQTGDTLREAMSKIWYWIQKIVSPGFVPTSGYGNAGNAWDGVGMTGDIWFQGNGNNPRGIGGHMSQNDAWRIIGAGDSSISPGNDASNPMDCGYLEIATADNGVEPIVARQYTSGNNSVFNRLVRTLYLLDKNGNTEIPGLLQFRTGYRGIRWTDSSDPKTTGTTAGDAAYVGTIQTSNAFIFEIGVADDGDEQVVVRQRKNVGATGPGVWGNWASIPIARTAYLLNSVGNTVFPGSCTATSHPTSSDLKKKDVHGKVDLETAEKLIMGLDPILYNFKGDWKESAGFGAQDVYKLTHEIGLKDNGLYRAALKPDKDGNAEGIEYHDSDIEALDDSDLEWNLNYTEFIPYLVKVIQDQHVRLVEQEERIDALEEKLMEVIKCLQ
jgi:hypothetical protein